MANLTSARAGILYLLAGIAIFSIQDVILKVVSGTYPLWQAMLVRSLTALPLLALIVWLMDGRLSTITTRGWPLMLARGGLNCLSYTAYYLGLARLPMADTVALFFTAPLFITLTAAVFLRERIGLVTVLALAAGTAGVLMIVRPGSDVFDPAAILPVLGALGYALSMISARVLGRRESAAAMAFWGNVTFLIFAIALAVLFGSGALEGLGGVAFDFMTRGWQPLTLWDTFLFALCGVIAAIGLVTLTAAYRIAPSATVAPFEYSFIFWGVLWGWVFWGDWPVPLAWVGIAVLVAAGMVVIRSEARNEDATADKAPAGLNKTAQRAD